MNTVMIVAAEASSAHFAQRLLEYWKSEKRQIQAFGVGTQSMEDLGFERVGKAEEMAVVGIAEIIEQYSLLKSVFNRLVEEAIRRKPDVVVVMDYPDFNLMLAKKLHAQGIPVVYYISPQIWAWRKGRIHKIKEYCRKVLVLFPFEVPIYEAKSVPVEFVGHPLLDEIPEKFFTESYRQFHRQKYGIHNDEIVVGLMPGSRRSELRLNLPVQMEAAKLLCQQFPKVRIAILVAPTFTKEQVQEQLQGDYPFSYILLKDEPGEMIHLTDYVIVASGTATLMVGLLRKPMVIMYRVKRATYLFGKLIGFKVDFFGLPNLILGRSVVPERIQTSAESLFEEIKKYLQDKNYADTVRQELGQLQSRLGEKGATKRVAKALDEFLG